MLVIFEYIFLLSVYLVAVVTLQTHCRRTDGTYIYLFSEWVAAVNWALQHAHGRPCHPVDRRAPARSNMPAAGMPICLFLLVLFGTGVTIDCGAGNYLPE